MDEWLSSSHSTPTNAPTPGQAMRKLPYEAEQYVINEEHDHTAVAHFDLDSIDFIMPDDLGSGSKAFPPSAYPDNTPALLPNGQNHSFQQHAAQFQSPLLPGQNEKSYNEEHLFHKQRQQQSQNQHLHSSSHSYNQTSSGVRPDAVFTPLVSPAVTPLESQVNTNNGANAPMQTTFEPLTSPALHAQQRNERPSSDRRRPSSATFGPDDYSSGGSTKRRTPHTTPNLAAHPHKSKRSPSLRKPSQAQPVFEQLPDSSYDASMDLPTKSSETTPMLPPQGRKVPMDGSSSGANTPTFSAKNAQGAGPATLMGFTMNRLAESQINTSNSSPTSEPRSGRRDDPVSSRSSLSGHRVSVKQETSSSEPSPAIDPQNGDIQEGTRKREKGPGKKASHKIAEQGRRNRMNQAVHELANLIPQHYHEQVTIPSKATTIELASKYINALLKELDEVKSKLPQDNSHSEATMKKEKRAK
ncbi:phosphate-sensing transcription factor [Candidozyma auris]|uniref:BHLH domain-containing protein n=2 Tax=Candidozyma auris TaxID=498019 RepID=A0A2H1A1N1_CANAR|nr:hypothetical protein QG37_07897 [[Candida] auris]PIS56789.1 hypothetical protein B9J08_001332 [[Candida] auris]QWW23952.1 hypothetical protein CA7LBN_002786 [[Candida] auris]